MDDLIMTNTEITAQETQYDFYQEQQPLCDDCGGFTFGFNECYIGEEVK